MKNPYRSCSNAMHWRCIISKLLVIFCPVMNCQNRHKHKILTYLTYSLASSKLQWKFYTLRICLPNVFFHKKNNITFETFHRILVPQIHMFMESAKNTACVGLNWEHSTCFLFYSFVTLCLIGWVVLLYYRKQNSS